MEKNYAEELTIQEVQEKMIKLNHNHIYKSFSGNEPTLTCFGTIIPFMKVPEGWYWNEKDGLTNKDNTKSGNWVSIRIIFI